MAHSNNTRSKNSNLDRLEFKVIQGGTIMALKITFEFRQTGI